MAKEISQHEARAMRAVLRHLSESYKIDGAVSVNDMKLVRSVLDIVAVSEEGRPLWRHQRVLMAELLAVEGPSLQPGQE